MLIVSEERVMAVGQISKRASQIEAVLNRGPVIHRSEVVFLDGENHKLLEDLVAHHELFAGAGDVSVVVQNSHAGIASDLHLHSNVASEISMDLSLLCGMNSRVKGCSRVVKTLVSDLIDHIII